MTDLSGLDPETLAEVVRKIQILRKRNEQRVFNRMYPDETKTYPDGTVYHARDLYPRHMEFFGAGAEYRERCAMAANRIGKTFGMGGYETAAHLTGRYPKWWPGRRFTKPIAAWAAGKTNETTRDIVQQTLFGPILTRGQGKKFAGTGVIPGDTIGSLTWKQGVTDLADTIKVKHKSGGWSTLGLKSYQQGRGSFEGTAQHLIWFDEEPPLDVYGEALIRTATTNGILLITFTPLEGMSEVVISFMPKEQRPEAEFTGGGSQI